MDAHIRRLITAANGECLVAELPRLDEVVLLTAAENYRLQPFEKQGMTGYQKYEAAGIEFRVADARVVCDR